MFQYCGKPNDENVNLTFHEKLDKVCDQKSPSSIEFKESYDNWIGDFNKNVNSKIGKMKKNKDWIDNINKKTWGNEAVIEALISRDIQPLYDLEEALYKKVIKKNSEINANIEMDKTFSEYVSKEYNNDKQMVLFASVIGCAG